MICPQCGSEVASGARACTECGSDEPTGWAPDAQHYGLLPSEPAESPRHDLPSLGWAAVIAALVAVVVFATAGGVVVAAMLAGVVAFGLATWHGVTRLPFMRVRARRRDLLRLVGGDVGIARRLVDRELKRRPDATLERAIRLAILGVERDRR
jgi:hypothetical protein